MRPNVVALVRPIAVACGSPSAEVDAGVDAYTELPDAGPPDVYPPPVVPHECDAEGACLDWIAHVGASDFGAFIGDVLPRAGDVVIVGGAESERFAMSGLPVAGGSVGVFASRGRAAYVAIIDTSGAPIGGEAFDPTGNQDAFNGVAELPGGDLVAVGYTNVSDATATDHQLLAVRMSSAGAAMWTQTYGAMMPSGVTGAAGEYATDVAVSPDGRVFVTGVAASAFPGAIGAPGGALVMELDPATGMVLWSRTFGDGRASHAAATASAVYITLGVTAGTGEMLDLGAAGTFALDDNAGNAFVVSLSPSDGAPVAAYQAPGAPEVSITSLHVEADGLLFSAAQYDYMPTTGDINMGGHVYEAPFDLTAPRASVGISQRGVRIWGVARSSGGDLVVTGTAVRQFEMDMLVGFSAGNDPWLQLFDRFGRARATKYDGDGQGRETMRPFASADDRVYLAGYYTETFEFETMRIFDRAGSRFGWDGYLIQTTIPP
jgi:hypothetical protein